MSKKTKTKRQPLTKLERLVSENFKALRLNAKMSQRATAKKAGISISYVSMLERGQRSPPISTLESLAKAFNVAPTYFFLPRPTPQLLASAVK